MLSDGFVKLKSWANYQKHSNITKVVSVSMLIKCIFTIKELLFCYGT